MLALRRTLLGSGLLLLLFLTPSLHAQEEDLFGSTEDDSLLFGDEFDLGGDAGSFDFEDTEATDPAATEEDDFFGDFDEEEDLSAEEDTTAVTDDWGFGDDVIAEDSTADVSESKYTDHPLDFRKSTQGTFLEGTGFTFSLYSPQVVNEKLDTWYSYLDFSLSVELPWHYEMDPFSVSFIVDVSSFSFENSFPSGGTFKGFTLIPSVRAEALGFEAEAGLGMYYPTWGIMAGMGYSIQVHSLFLSAGYRWNWASKIDPVGAAWWLEPRITTGFKF